MATNFIKLMFLVLGSCIDFKSRLSNFDIDEKPLVGSEIYHTFYIYALSLYLPLKIDANLKLKS